MAFNTGHAIVLSFSIFIFLAYWFGFQKFVNLLDEQIIKIKKRLDLARFAKEDAFGALNLQKRRNLQITSEIEEIANDAQEEWRKIREKFMEDFEKIKASRTQLAAASIDQFSHDIMQNFKAEVIDLSILSFTKLLKDHVSAQQHEWLNQDAIHQINTKLKELNERSV